MEMNNIDEKIYSIYQLSDAGIDNEPEFLANVKSLEEAHTYVYNLCITHYNWMMEEGCEFTHTNPSDVINPKDMPKDIVWTDSDNHMDCFFRMEVNSYGIIHIAIVKDDPYIIRYFIEDSINRSDSESSEYESDDS